MLDTRPAVHLLDYLERELATFDEKPFGPADSLVLSQLAMIEAKDLVPALGQSSPGGMRPAAVHLRDLLRAEHYPTMFTGLAPDLVRQALVAAAASPRFRDLELGCMVDVLDTAEALQFAALTFTKPGSFVYLAFRGTDTTRAGWREDFNMSYTWPVPCQREAIAYTQAVAALTNEPLILGGHSKGGNLATYALAKVAPHVQERVAIAYNHDGPGFRREALDDREYARVANRCHKTVPVESIVGMSLERGDDFGVVCSAQRGVAQHNAFNWEIDLETGDFAYAPKLADSSEVWRRALLAWVESYSVCEMERIVDALFEAVEASGAMSASVMVAGGVKALASLVDLALSVNAPTRGVLLGAAGALGDNVAKALGGAGGVRTSL